MLKARPEWPLSRKQAGASIGWLKSRLAHSGVRASVLIPLGGDALRPVKTDVLALL
jgi:hypothetical protein